MIRIGNLLKPFLPIKKVSLTFLPISMLIESFLFQLCLWLIMDMLQSYPILHFSVAFPLFSMMAELLFLWRLPSSLIQILYRYLIFVLIYFLFIRCLYIEGLVMEWSNLVFLKGGGGGEVGLYEEHWAKKKRFNSSIMDSAWH